MDREGAAGMPAVRVEHRSAERRYVVEEDGHTAVLEYRRLGRSFVFTHTGVPEELAGHGVGSALVATVLDEVRAKDLVAVPLCPFVRSYIRKHPEYLDLVGFGERGDRLN